MGMQRHLVLILAGALAASGSPAAIAEAAAATAEGQSAAERRDRENESYQRAQEALDQERWQAALDRFSEVAALSGRRADAALYWKAYALSRLGQPADALGTLAELGRAFPSSFYAAQARALEVEVRRLAGQPVAAESAADEDLKLLAIQGLQQSDPERAVPMLEKILQGAHSSRVKERALFVLAQSGAPRARDLLAETARGADPDLQRKAVRYLGLHGGRESRETLAAVYASTQDLDVKRQILRAFMVAGERARVLNAATGETVPELRAEAVRLLGGMGAHDELWQLYQKEADAAVKRQILQAMFVGGDAGRLTELARTERDPELRRTAVRNLGLLGASRTGEALAEIYASDQDPQVRRAAADALFIQNNAGALVALARQETDPALRRHLVQKLSLMRSQAALDYLMEIIEK